MSKKINPTNEEWKALYKVAENFNKKRAWEWMYDDDIFGVQDPETGETAYVCIMGNAGEHFGIAGYLGTEGLDGVLDMLSGAIDPEDPENVFSQKCIICSFEDRSMIGKDELKRIKDLELKFRGANQWPVFRHYEPGLLPWTLTGSQCRFMTHIINQAMEVSERAKKDKSFLVGKKSDTYFTRVCNNNSEGDLIWADKFIDYQPHGRAYVSFNLKDELLVKKLSTIKAKKNLVFEIDTFYAPAPIADNERPYFPKICAIFDHHIGVAVSFEMYSNYEKEAYKSVEFVANYVEHNKAKPSKILVARDETYYLFSDFCKQADIKIELVDELMHASNARLELFRYMKNQQ